MPVTKEEVKIPRNGYFWRVQKAEKAISKDKGNPMLKLTCELVKEPPMLIDGEQVDVNGLVATKYLSPLTNKRTVNEFRESCEMPPIEEADLPNIEAGHYEGRIFHAIGSTNEEDQIDRDTKQPVINKLTGKPVRSSRLEIGRILTKNS
jgi:hypothetical protein